MAKQFVISIMARDRIGIVADVATAIKNLQGNLADMSQTVLRGFFTMILVAKFPESVGVDELRRVLVSIQPDEPFEVGLRQCDEEPRAEPVAGPDRRYVLTATGPDKIGLVAGVAEYLRQKKINIDDLATRVDDGIYTMILLLNLAPTVDVAKLKHSIRIAMSDVDVSVELKHHEIFRATNEI